MLPLLFLHITEGDIFLIIFYFALHLVNLILFLIAYFSKLRIFRFTVAALAIQFIMSAIVLAGFINLFSVASVLLSAAMVFLLFRKRNSSRKSI